MHEGGIDAGFNQTGGMHFYNLLNLGKRLVSLHFIIHYSSLPSQV